MPIEGMSKKEGRMRGWSGNVAVVTAVGRGMVFAFGTTQGLVCTVGRPAA